MSDVAVPFERHAVQPLACYRQGWALIGPNYWTYFGVAAIGLLVASAAPLGLLMGPMFCGIYHCYLRGFAGEKVELAGVFRGFDHALQSIVAALLMMIPGFLLGLAFAGSILLWGLLLVRQVPPGGSGGGEAVPSLLALVALLVLLGVLLLLFLLPMTALLGFVFPLIVDRKLDAVGAVRMSIRAGWANFLPLVGLCLLNMALGCLGGLFCYVGIFFLLPWTMAANAAAYRQVFPELRA